MSLKFVTTKSYRTSNRVPFDTRPHPCRSRSRKRCADAVELAVHRGDGLREAVDLVGFGHNHRRFRNRQTDRLESTLNKINRPNIIGLLYGSISFWHSLKVERWSCNVRPTLASTRSMSRSTALGSSLDASATSSTSFSSCALTKSSTCPNAPATRGIFLSPVFSTRLWLGRKHHIILYGLALTRALYSTSENSNLYCNGALLSTCMVSLSLQRSCVVGAARPVRSWPARRYAW